MDLAGDVHLLQMCCDETTIQVRVVHFVTGRFLRPAGADGTFFPRQQMPEREEKEERDMKERKREMDSGANETMEESSTAFGRL